MALFYLVKAVAIIVLFSTSRDVLQPWAGYTEKKEDSSNDNSVDNSKNETASISFEIASLPIANSAYLSILGVSIFLATMSLLLLLHLCIFHLFINYVGITTYEYVRAQRLEQEKRARKQQEEQSRQMMRHKVDEEVITAEQWQETSNEKCLGSYCLRGRVRPREKHYVKSENAHMRKKKPDAETKVYSISHNSGAEQQQKVILSSSTDEDSPKTESTDSHVSPDELKGGISQNPRLSNLAVLPSIKKRSPKDLNESVKKKNNNVVDQAQDDIQRVGTARPDVAASLHL